MAKRPTQRQRGRCPGRRWRWRHALRRRQGAGARGDSADRRHRLAHRAGPAADSWPAHRPAGATANGPQWYKRQGPPANDQQAEFVASILGDTEDTWKALFAQAGKQYRDPKLVLFSGQVNSACGFASAAVGPFYCPADQRVYLDMSFFREMETRFAAAGDFAQAYVIAHEIGHHVQTLLGVSAKVDAARRAGQRMEGDNGLLVRQELQADCLAGVWAYQAQKRLNWLEPGDVEEALNAANAIGDDRLQQQGRGRVVPDSFTHGTSAQRVRWFKIGFAEGEVNRCDTFSARTL